MRQTGREKQETTQRARGKGNCVEKSRKPGALKIKVEAALPRGMERTVRRRERSGMLRGAGCEAVRPITCSRAVKPPRQPACFSSRCRLQDCGAVVLAVFALWTDISPGPKSHWSDWCQIPGWGEAWPPHMAGPQRGSALRMQPRESALCRGQPAGFRR